jgi:hypothetical protein
VSHPIYKRISPVPLLVVFILLFAEVISSKNVEIFDNDYIKKESYGVYHQNKCETKVLASLPIHPNNAEPLQVSQGKPRKNKSVIGLTPFR